MNRDNPQCEVFIHVQPRVLQLWGFFVLSLPAVMLQAVRAARQMTKDMQPFMFPKPWKWHWLIHKSQRDYLSQFQVRSNQEHVTLSVETCLHTEIALLCCIKEVCLPQLRNSRKICKKFTRLASGQSEGCVQTSVVGDYIGDHREGGDKSSDAE